MIPSKRVLNHFMVSAWVTRWGAPIRDLQRLRLATRSPGRLLKTCQFPYRFQILAKAHSHAAVEVHAVDTDGGVVLDTQVDVLADTEAEVAGFREVALAEFVLLDLEATLEDLLSLGATDGNVDGNLFVTTDTEGTDGIAGLAYRSSKLHRLFLLLPPSQVVFEAPYCRQGSGRSTARAPWPHG